MPSGGTVSKLPGEPICAGLPDTAHCPGNDEYLGEKEAAFPDRYPASGVTGPVIAGKVFLPAGGFDDPIPASSFTA